MLNSRVAEQQSDWQSENWTEVLGKERLTGAALDPLTHRCQIIETKGEELPPTGRQTPAAESPFQRLT